MIRKATDEDFARIVEVRNAVRENRLAPANASRVSDTARWIYQNGTVWVWEQDGAVQGFVLADVRDGTIFGLFVHPDYEGHGIAQALLPLACEDLRAAGHNVATLTTDQGTRAERFYLRNGWTDTGRRIKEGIVFERPLTR